MEEVHREVEQAARDALAVDEHVLFLQMPAAWPDHDRGERLVWGEPVILAVGAGEVDAAVECVLEIKVAGDHVVPQRRVGVLEVGQPHLGAGVQRVDRHLLVGRAGDLDPAVHQASGRRCHAPAAVRPDLRGFSQEVERRAGAELLLPGRPGGEQFCPPRAEFALQQRDQIQGLWRQDFLVPIPDRAVDLDSFAVAHSW